MINSFVLFFGLLILFVLGKVSFIFQLFLSLILFYLAHINNLSTIALIKKIKYFLFALILIYPLITPGELFFYYSFVSISYEGIFIAIENVFRLGNIFMVVMILSNMLPKDFFIRFLIKLCYPFTLLGCKIERVSARLYLTFEYLEVFKKHEFKFSRISEDIVSKLDSKNINRLDNKILLIKPELNDYIWVLIFILLISSVELLIL